MRNILKIQLPSVLFFVALLLSVLVYFPSLNSGFLFDDVSNIIDAEFIRISELTFDSLLSAASSGGDLNGRPLAMISFAINYYIGGIDPYSYKIVNLAIHLLTGIALYYLLSQLLKTELIKSSIRLQGIKFLPVAVVSLWLISPINFLPVVYVVQRMTSMATFFMVVGMLSYVQLRTERAETNIIRAIFLVACILISTILAILCKENGILLVLHLVLIECIFFKFRSRFRWRSSALYILMTLVFIAPVLIAVSYLIKYPDYFDTSYINRNFTAAERVLTEFRVLVLYLKQMLFPVLGDFSLHHDDVDVSTSILQPLTTLWSVFILLFISIVGFVSRNNAPLISYGIAVFFIGHTIESSVFALDLMYEHRNYLSSFGICLATISFLFNLNNKDILKSWRVGIGTIATIMVLINSVYVTASRSNLWSNDLDRLQYAILKHPNSPRINNEIGALYAKMSAVDSPYKEMLIEKAIYHQKLYTALDENGTEGLVGMISLASYHEFSGKLS